MAEPLVRDEAAGGGAARITLQAPPASTCSFEMMRELPGQLFESADAAPGLAANLEQRKPVFSGR